MPWWIWLVIVLLVYLFAGWWGKRKNLRAIATVNIPDHGAASVKFTPEQVEPTELVRLALVYGSKLKWLLLREPVALQMLFDTFTSEAVDALCVYDGPLLLNMPTAWELLAETARQRAVPGGERFVIRYYRTRYQMFRNESIVINDLPLPGLAINLVWNYCLLWDAISYRLDKDTRFWTRRASSLWWNAVIAIRHEDYSIRGMDEAIRGADTACEISSIEREIANLRPQLLTDIRNRPAYRRYPG